MQSGQSISADEVMSLFSTAKPVYFVFADSEDTYFSDSGLALRLDAYFWYQLCQAHCDGIYFIRASGESFQIVTCDEQSFQRFESRKKFLTRFFFGQSFSGKAHAEDIPRDKLADFFQWMLTQLRQDRQAFIFDLDTFCDLTERVNGEKIRSELIEFQRQQPSGTLFLRVPAEAEKSLPLFRREVFFAEYEGNRFCEKIAEIIQAPERIPFFPELKRRMGDAVLFLNAFTREQVRALVYAAQGEQDCFYSAQALEEMTDYLFYWCHSESMRGADIVLSASDWNFQYKNLFQQLKKELVWKNLRVNARKFHERSGNGGPVKLYDDLFYTLPPEKHAFVRGGWDLSREADSLELLEIAQTREAIKTFRSVRKALRTAWNWPVNRDIEHYAKIFLSALSAASRSGPDGDGFDDVSVNSAVQALSFCVSWLWTRGEARMEEPLSICEKYQQLVTLSQSLYRQGIQERRLRKQIRSLPDHAFPLLQEQYQLIAHKEQQLKQALEELREQLAAAEQQLNSRTLSQNGRIANAPKRQSASSEADRAEALDERQRQRDAKALRELADIHKW